MWIVRLALARPNTMFVSALLVGILGVLSIINTPTDIFPPIDIPVVDIIWNYGGLSPQEVEGRVTNQCERALANDIPNVEHIESSSIQGISIIKVYFQQGTDLATAIAQISSICQTVMHNMPPGMTPPYILQFNASNVPILQLSLTSNVESPAEINDEASNFIRPPLVTIKGVQLSPPYGGVYKDINVDMDPQKMYAKSITAADLTNAMSLQNLILPAGDAKIGNRDYVVRLNNSPLVLSDLNNLPIKMVNGAMVYMHDVAFVHSGHQVQSSMVDVNGQAAVLLTILKSGDASTLGVIDRVKAQLPYIRSQLPADLKVNTLLDQSIFVRAAITNVIREGGIAAILTGLMILLFLGSWRSTLIVFLSIPLSVLSSIVILSALGDTMNAMTLGGLSLAVGILVDDATVEIENTNRNLGLGMGLKEAILTSAEQVAVPALASTLSICIVFIPVAFLSGVARSLFLPLALAVVFAMLPSYLLSRTLVTTMMQALLVKEIDFHRAVAQGNAPKPRKWDLVLRANYFAEHKLEKLRTGHRHTLTWCLENRVIVLLIGCGFFIVSACLIPFVGEDFFPQVDSGQMRLHVRAPSGTRIEDTGRLFAQIEGTIAQVIPANQRTLILDNIGLAGSMNRVYNTSGTIGPSDGEIDISLADNRTKSTWEYTSLLRKTLNADYPQDVFYFQPADITSQILDFGISSPIDIQLAGPFRNNVQDLQLTRQILKEINHIPGIVDCYLGQIVDAPEIQFNVDREKAMEVGLTQQDVATSVLDSLASSSQTSPAYWLDPSNGVQYTVVSQTPQYIVNSIPAIMRTPVASSATGVPEGQSPQMFGNLATYSTDQTPTIISHYNINPLYDIYASVQDRDLGSVSRDIDKVLARYQSKLPRGSTLTVQGMVTTMNQSFIGLGEGMILAIVLVYILLVINFESWVDPFIILGAIPGALCGVVWMLFVTRTTFSVPALMGSIMCIGISTANSILLVTFANEQRLEGRNAKQAAIAAGYTRMRPVIMTATAMLIGVLPMALGLGEGGEQNAPLGRAVIGGLLVATFSTLLFVPVVYSVLRKKQPEVKHEDEVGRHTGHWNIDIPDEDGGPDGTEGARTTNGAHAGAQDG